MKIIRQYLLNISCLLALLGPQLTYAAADQTTNNQPINTRAINTRAITTLAELDHAIKEIIEREKVPSVAYAIVKKDQQPHLRVLGLANREKGLSANLDTRYRIASISKMLVGVAVMQLVEKGDISLTDKIADVLPDFAFENPWAKSHPLQLVHLLENTTGWDEIALREFAYKNYPPLDLASSLQLNPDSRISRWPPGTRHAYTNSAATVAALLVEKITGMSFYSYVQQYIFNPLNITSATYDEPGSDFAKGYRKGLPVPFKYVLMRPSGSISMNIQDMAKLTALFLQRGKNLLSAESVARIEHQRSTNVGGFKPGYGLYNYSRYYHNWQFRGHDGALPGWLSELSYSPEFGAGFVLLQNSEQSASFRRIVELLSQYLIQDFVKPNINKETVPDRWLAMSGYYRYINPRMKNRFFLERLAASYQLEITPDKAVFSTVFPPGWFRHLTYVGNDQWRNDKGELVLALANDPVAGQVIHYGDRVFVPVSGLSAWLDKIVAIVWLLLLTGALFCSLIWLVKWFRKKPYQPKALRLRLWFSGSALSSFAFLFFLGIGLTSAITMLGQLSLFSVGLMMASVVMAVVTLMAACQLVNMRKALSGTWLFRISSLFISVQLIVVIYLGWYGVIGIQTWA